jgi:hypothetical protein
MKCPTIERDVRRRKRVLTGLQFATLSLSAVMALHCSDDVNPPGGAAGAAAGAAQGGTQSAAGSAGSSAAAGSASGGNASGSGGASSTAGAGGSSAGASGAGGSGGGGGGGGAAGSGGSSCASKGYLLCEDFESTAEGAIPSGWTKDGVVAVTSDQAAHGSHSLKVGDAENGPRRINRSATEFGTAHWGRVFYRVGQPVPTVNPGKNNNNTVIHSTMVQLVGPLPGGGEAQYRMVDTIMNQAKKHNFIYNIQIVNGSEDGVETAYTYDYTATWKCAEWHVDNVAKNYNLYIDGVDIEGVAIVGDKAVKKDMNARLPDSFTVLNLGWYNYQAGDGGFTVWIDDLAIGSARVGCDG